MIDKYIADEEPQWKLLMLLLGYLDIIFTPKITDGLITQLEFLIEGQLKKFKLIIYSDNEQLGKCNKLIIGNLQVEIGNIMRESLNINIFDEVYVTHLIAFGSYEIKLGFVLCHDVVESYPQYRVGSVFFILHLKRFWC